VSGRALSDVKKMVGLPGLACAGTSGLEIEVDGACLRLAGVRQGRALAARLAKRLERGLSAFRGAWVERKPLGLTLHYRALSRGQAAGFRTRAWELLDPHAGRVDVVEGPRSLEVTPALGWTKGTAVRLMARRMAGAGAIVLYAGDAPNDAAAFEAVEALGGISVGVGAGAPRTVRVRVPGPGALAKALTRLLARLSGEGGR
jgi:trehalose-phosphatase